MWIIYRRSKLGENTIFWLYCKIKFLQGEPCLMGVKRIYRKLKPMAKCVMGKTHSVTVTSDPCECTESDFEWWVIPFLRKVHLLYFTTYITTILYWSHGFGFKFQGVIVGFLNKIFNCQKNNYNILYFIFRGGNFEAIIWSDFSSGCQHVILK